MGKTFTLGLYPNIGISSSGTPTTNYLPKFASATTIGNSIISENSNEISLNVAFPTLIFNGSRDYALQSNDTSGSFRIIDNTAGLERFSIANSGVATFSSGQINITGAGTSIQLQGTSYGNIAADKTLYLDSGASSDMILRTNGGTERMRITSGGNVTIGSSSSVYNFNVYGASGADGWGAFFGGAGTTKGGIYIGNNGTQYGTLYFDNANNNVYLKQSYASGSVYVIANTNGVYLANGATSWTANSDINLKNIINEISDATKKISKIKTVNFTWKSDETNKPQIGVIAQSVQEVLPELIDINKDGHLGVRYTELIPVLVKAIQELSSQNQDLKSRLDKAGL